MVKPWCKATPLIMGRKSGFSFEAGSSCTGVSYIDEEFANVSTNLARMKLTLHALQISVFQRQYGKDSVTLEFDPKFVLNDRRKVRLSDF